MEQGPQICIHRLFNTTKIGSENFEAGLLVKLKQLKSLIKGNSSLNRFAEFFDDHVLAAFILGKKSDVNKSYITLVNYVQLRQNRYPHIFKTLLPSSTLSMEKGILRFLKYRDQHNRGVIIMRLWEWDPYEVNIDDTHKMMILIMDGYLQIAHRYGIEGLVAVFDVKDTTFAQVKAANPSKIYQKVDLLWNNMPIRFSALHTVNGGILVNAFLKSIHPFLPKKLRERCTVHSSLESLHDHVPPNILPELLGGCLSEEDAFYVGMEEQIRKKENYYQKYLEKLQTLEEV